MDNILCTNTNFKPKYLYVSIESRILGAIKPSSSTMSAPLLRSAAQAVKTVPAAGAADTAVAARSAVAATGRSSTLTASITQQGGAASRTITTSSSLASPPVVLNKSITETLKDTARVVDQTSSEGLEKVIELAENAVKLTKEKENTAEAAAIGAKTTLDSNSSSGEIAAKIQSAAADAFEREQPTHVAQQPQGEGEPAGILASIEKLTPDFSSLAGAGR
ncbi:hypothetical protein TWF694_011272 [Orbilia ellipsospora]|uniref:Uncharacterized protein n=1 Tax=Orbilia ellipsospora TaxID=2528407 RepID=A0AAV9X909_9PEZI